MSQKKVITSSGFCCELDENALDDMELLETMGGIMEKDAKAIFAMPRMIERFIGPEGKAALYDHCRTDEGRVPTSAIMAEFTEIMQGLEGDKKKS